MKIQTTLVIITSLLLCVVLMNGVQAVPHIVPYVNDFANILTSEQEQQLNVLCDEIEESTTYEIAIVTVKDTEGQARVEYANKIGDESGVGKKDKDNGIVVLWSLGNERGGAIATGRGSESIFNDAKVGRIGRENKHYFEDEKYYEGFESIVKSLAQEINSTLTNSSSLDNTGEESESFKNFFVFALIFLGIFIMIAIISSSDSSDDYSYGSSGVTFIPGLSSSSGRSRGSFSGGSFGGGGGSF